MPRSDDHPGFNLQRVTTTVAAAGLYIMGCLWMSRMAPAEDWSRFQNGGAIGLQQADLPVSWSTDKGIAWQVSLAGYGQSSPIVDGDRVYVTSVAGEMKDKLFVQAISVKSGEQLWRHEAKNSSPEKSSNYISRAAPTPACDENGVIAAFEGGNVIALTRDGAVRWQRNLAADYGVIKARHGLASSLEQDERHIFVWIEREAEPYIVAVSKVTGATVWKSPGLGVTTWSSPRLVPVEGSPHLVLSGIGKIAGLDPLTGKRLWEFKEISGNSAPTPLPLGKGRFLIGASAGRGEGDTGRAAASNGVIEIRQIDGQFVAKWVWQAKKATSSFGSPVAYENCAYFVNRSGVLYCLDLASGKEHYAKRTPGSCWATPITVANRLFLFGKQGTTAVVQAGVEFKLLNENTLWKEDSVGEPAAPGGRSFGGPVLYAAVPASSHWILRRGDRLYAVSK